MVSAWLTPILKQQLVAFHSDHASGIPVITRGTAPWKVDDLVLEMAGTRGLLQSFCEDSIS